MTRTYKPTTLHFHHNADLSITIRAGGKKMMVCKFYGYWDNREDAMAFARGWFGEHPIRIRETWANKFKVAA